MCVGMYRYRVERLTKNWIYINTNSLCWCYVSWRVYRLFTVPKITTWKYLLRQLSRRIYLHCILLPEAVSNNKHRVDVNAQLISSNEYRLNSDFGVDRVLYGVARGKFNKISLIITRARERDRERERNSVHVYVVCIIVAFIGLHTR